MVKAFAISLLRCVLALSSGLTVSQAQDLDLLLVNGHLIDPSSGVDARMDVGIANGKIAVVASMINQDRARKVVDVNGLYISPGFIDMHTHLYSGSGPGFADGINSIFPDDIAPRSGVTTMVDAGTSGWLNFAQFRSQIIQRAKTRVLAFVSIGARGLAGKAHQEDISAMNADSACAVARRYPDDIVGIKIGHFEKEDWTPFNRALDAANCVGKPLLVECHLPHYTLADQLKRMRPGDIITHAFEKVSERTPVVNENGHIHPYVREAHQRGILFDVGHGGAGFWFSQSIPALQQGLAPNSFGTDTHRFSINAGMKDFSNLLSKYMAMGMDLRDVVAGATWNAAQALKRPDLGGATAGSVADLVVWRLRQGSFGFVDAGGEKIVGNQKIEVELTLREGRVVWDLNGLTAIPYDASESKQK